MKVSVLLPTRKRINLLNTAIKSLLDNFSGDNEIEILLRFDDDDLDTVDAVKKIVEDKRVIYFIGEKYGYAKLHYYMNELASKAKGDWLMLMNDDAIVQTKNWDKEIEKYNGQIVFLDSQLNHSGYIMVFAIIPRKVFEVLGHISLAYSSDTWTYEIGKILNINRITPIRIFHDRGDVTGNNKDETYYGRIYDRDDFYSSENKTLRENDAALLRNYIAKEKH